MRLYPKRIRSIEDLEKEKKLLLKEAKLLEEQDLLSFEGIFGKKGAKEDGDEEGSILDLLHYLPISNPLFDVGIKLAKTWANRSAKKGKESGREWEKEKQKESAGEKESGGKKGVLRKVAVEVIGGYLKWKAIELSFKGVKHIVKTRKANKKEQ